MSNSVLRGCGVEQMSIRKQCPYCDSYFTGKPGTKACPKCSEELGQVKASIRMILQPKNSVMPNQPQSATAVFSPPQPSPCASFPSPAYEAKAAKTPAVLHATERLPLRTATLAALALLNSRRQHAISPACKSVLLEPQRLSRGEARQRPVSGSAQPGIGRRTPGCRSQPRHSIKSLFLIGEGRIPLAQPPAPKAGTATAGDK